MYNIKGFYTNRTIDIDMNVKFLDTRTTNDTRSKE